MATDGVNIATEDAEMAECDGDKVVTMMDVLQEQQEFEEDANAVLGASDDKNCTYSKGYIKRQALYACLTCCTEAKTDPTKRAGVCLACSLNCHENHELIELYTKRNFRCDCGNPKFNSHPCTFTQDKVDLNDENIYNQNFSGLYCTCQRPYPDPESTIEDDMIQCIICEDWLHASHLETVVPANDQYAEMVCKACMEKNEFLHDYSLFAVHVETGDVDVTINGDAKSPDNSFCNGGLAKEKMVNGVEENKTDIDGTDVTVDKDVEMNDNNDSKDKVEDGLENVKIDERIALEASGDSSNVNVGSIESELQENDNSNNVNDNKIDLDTESKKTEKEEKTVDSTNTNELTENNETSVNPESSNVDGKNTSAGHPENTNLIENSSKIEPNLDNDTSDGDYKTITNEKTDKNEEINRTETEPQEVCEALKKHPETQEINIEQLKKDSSKEDSLNENINDGDKTEQQLLDDLSSLTDDNPTSKLNKDMDTDKTLTDDTDQCEKGKINNADLPIKTYESEGSSEEKPVSDDTEEGKINNADLPKQTYESESSSEENPVSHDKTASTDVDVPDRIQSQNEEIENTNNKTDSVMDAIDELLQTANETKEGENAEVNHESTSELKKTKTVENIESTDSNDVEMRTENKSDNEIPEKADDTTNTIDTLSNDGTKDIEMTDASVEKQPGVNENKADPTIDSGINDEKDMDASEITSKNEISVIENESPKDEDEKSEVTDSVNENICKEKVALNINENKEAKITENDCENKVDLSSNDNPVPNLIENTKEHKRKLSSDFSEDILSKKAKLECVRPKGVKRVHKGATFWPSNFRQKLCTCAECLTMYKDLKVLFLTDLEDTVFAYESLGKENVAGGASQYEKGLQALSSLDRIQQINALTEYNKMRDKLLDFLKSFKDRKEIVKEEDIKAFFAGMKPRREPDGVYFCR